MTTPSSLLPAAFGNPQPDSHYEVLNSAIPSWLGQSSQQARNALKTAKLSLGQALGTAPSPLKSAFTKATAEHWTARNKVEQTLKQLEDAKAFAKPILEEALLKRFNLELDCETTYLRLYIPLTTPWFTVRTGAARTWTVSLLDAALHNFESAETKADAYEADSTFITRPSASGQFDTLPAVKKVLSITAFTQLCRELDIGAQYARHVREALGLDEPVAASVLQHKVIASHTAALRNALHLARINGDIAEDMWRAIGELIEGKPARLQDGQPLRAYDLHMMEAPLNGVLLFAVELEHPRSVQSIVAYVPDDPRHPIKEYASSLAFKQALTEKLRDEQYQGFFSRFVNHEHHGPFFSGLSQRLARITWHPPQSGSNLAPWRKEPTTDPRLNFSAHAIAGDLWEHVYEQRLNQIINDARTRAISTAEADRKARWAAWDAFVNEASSIVNAVVMVVAPFIPGLGELMLGYMAYQLLDEVFEGIIDWAMGESSEAFGHLMSVLESLVQVGAFAAGSTIGVKLLRQVAPPDVLAFIDGFKPVTLANGGERYWKKDLKAYQQKKALPPRLGINEQGLHTLPGASVLPLEGDLYAVQPLADSEQYVITHPTRPDAYTPRLQHNGSGAWHSELEDPLRWDRTTLLRRLGHDVSELSEADRELALTLSGVDDDALRKMHVLGDPVPPLLADTLERVRIDRSLHTLIDRLNSDDPATYQLVDPQDLLHLLITHGEWPETRCLRILDAQGNTVWEFGDTDKPAVQIQEAQLTKDQLLKELLKRLAPEEIRSLFGERAADPELSLDNRANQWRKKLARVAERRRAMLFDSRYAQLQPTADAPAQQLIQSAPGLPTQVINHVLDHASAEELTELDNQNTPPRLADLARSTLDELRINRAYESLHLETMPTVDSERLALNTLRIQPGWPGNLRIEARHLTAQGEMWLHIGVEDATIVRTLVRTADGRYVPHDEKGPLSGETDLYTAILNALPDAQRDALGLGVNQGPALREQLRQRPLPREELRQVLDTYVIKPPTLETLRLLGMDAGYPIQDAPPAPVATLEERARAMYPALDQQQIQDLLTHLHTQPGGAANGLAALAEEYLQLCNDLTRWRRQIPALHPETGVQLSEAEWRNERRNRRMISNQLRRCWRREEAADLFLDPSVDGYSLRLDYPILGALPELTANFDHVSLLTLSGRPQTASALAFLGRFQSLRHLIIRGLNLGSVPDLIFNLPHLNSLSLGRCNLRLTPADQARIASLRGLQSLVLHENPLDLAPSVEAMTNLTHLDLSHTQIEQLPDGLVDRPHLIVALLSNARIRELPPALFSLPPHKGSAFDLSGNPLSRAAVQQIKSYYQAHRVRFGANALHSDLRKAQQLYPSLHESELNQLIYDLPGTVEAGQVELQRRAAELETLQAQLQQWQDAPGISGQEFARRISLCMRLERCWRHQLTETGVERHALFIPRELTGALPAIDASFDHISVLIMEGNNAPLNVDSFLTRFPELLSLSLSQTVLGDIPLEVFSRAKLVLLRLEACAIRLSANSRARLERLSNLSHLNLNSNPLGAPIDFSRLTQLTTVHLRETGLDTVPPTLLTDVQRYTVDLSGNAITQLPPELFALPEHPGRVFDLSANPLTPRSLDLIKSYCQRTDDCFHVQTSAVHRNRTRQLYPRMSEEHMDRLIFGLPGSMEDIDAELTELEGDYTRLVAELQHWANDTPEQHPLTGGVLSDDLRSADEVNRRRFKRLLQEAWRRESPIDEDSLDDRTTYEVVFNQPIIGTLPQLSVRVDHVTCFDLRGAFTITEINGTLEAFPSLQTLIVTNCTLGKLPPAIFAMPKLSALDLSDCEIALTPAEARSISDLDNLEFLHLDNNPLGNAPDVSALHLLNTLKLSNTQISQVPDGLFQLHGLQTLDLSNNALRDIPADIMEIQQVFDLDSDLQNNPWTPESFRLLREYYLRTGNDFQILEVTLDDHGNPLEPRAEEPIEE